MKESSTKITIRMTIEEKKKLNELALKAGTSINQTVLNLIENTIESNEIKTELSSTKDQVNLLSETVGKQTKAIIDLISALKNKGVI